MAMASVVGRTAFARETLSNLVRKVASVVRAVGDLIMFVCFLKRRVEWVSGFRASTWSQCTLLPGDAVECFKMASCKFRAYLIF
jgi:hypothetical protein